MAKPGGGPAGQGPGAPPQAPGGGRGRKDDITLMLIQSMLKGFYTICNQRWPDQSSIDPLCLATASFQSLRPSSVSFSAAPQNCKPSCTLPCVVSSA